MTTAKRRRLLFLLLVPVLALAFELRVKDKMVDFSVNYQAAERLRAGETIYRPSDGHYQFKYMPFSAFLYLPLTLLPLPTAKAVWFGLVIASSILIFGLSIRILRPTKREALVAVSVGILVLGRYFLREIQLGQINALIAALLMSMMASLDAGEEPGARGIGAWGRPGVAWGLATALKPYSLIYLPYFVLKRRWLPAASGLAVLGLAAFAPTLFYGPQGNLVVFKEWWATLSASTPALFSTQDNVSLMGFLTKWTGRQDVSLAVYACLIVALAGFVLILIRLGRRTARPHVLEGFLLLALIPLVSPLGWDYTLLSAAPAVMLIACHLDAFPGALRGLLFLDFALIGLSLYDLMGRALYARFMAASVITVCFLLVVGALAFLRVKGHA